MRRSARRTLPALSIALAAMWLTGCDGASSDAMCASLPLYAYSRAQQAQAAAELDGLPRGAVLPVMMADYGDWRARRRAVCGG